VKSFATSVALSLGLAAALNAGCAAGNPEACTVTCSDLGQCPSGTSCGEDNFCYEPNQEPGSCTDDGPPDAAPDPDGPIGQPDAPIDQPDAGGIDACAGPATFTGTDEAGGVVIPDNDKVGIDRTIQSDAVCGTVDTVQIHVEILHTFRGDIRIDLTAPGGALVNVLAPSLDGGDNINQTFDVVIAGGEPASGSWTLTVADESAQDIGTLVRWTIGINQPAPL
jgi:hypothetical protein